MAAHPVLRAGWIASWLVDNKVSRDSVLVNSRGRAILRIHQETYWSESLGERAGLGFEPARQGDPTEPLTVGAYLDWMDTHPDAADSVAFEQGSAQLPFRDLGETTWNKPGFPDDYEPDDLNAVRLQLRWG